MKLGLWCLLAAIALVYVFSAIRFLYIWSVDSRPSGLFDWAGSGLLEFWETVNYNRGFRYAFIFVIIGMFLLALALVTTSGPADDQGPPVKGPVQQAEIKIIEDDVILVRTPRPAKNPGGGGSGEIAAPNGSEVNLLSLEAVFTRQGAFGVFLKVANVLAAVFVGVVALVFLLSYVFVPNFIYTDLGHMLLDVAMVFELGYFLLRCPDFVKSLASTGFQRAYLKKIHLHESLLGLLLAIGGILLVMNGAGAGAYFERMTGIVLLLLGAFLAGRDWKDFARGKFLHD